MPSLASLLIVWAPAQRPLIRFPTGNSICKLFPSNDLGQESIASFEFGMPFDRDAPDGPMQRAYRLDNAE
jgi:hypothetical protein